MVMRRRGSDDDGSSFAGVGTITKGIPDPDPDADSLPTQRAGLVGRIVFQRHEVAALGVAPAASTSLRL
eukprot:755091-Hanusia_phi.AAC.11